MAYGLPLLAYCPAFVVAKTHEHVPRHANSQHRFPPPPRVFAPSHPRPGDFSWLRSFRRGTLPTDDGVDLRHRKFTKKDRPEHLAGPSSKFPFSYRERGRWPICNGRREPKLWPQRPAVRSRAVFERVEGENAHGCVRRYPRRVSALLPNSRQSETGAIRGEMDFRRRRLALSARHVVDPDRTFSRRRRSVVIVTPQPGRQAFSSTAVANRPDFMALLRLRRALAPPG